MSGTSLKTAPQDSRQAPDWAVLIAPDASVTQPDLTRAEINKLGRDNSLDLVSLVKVLAATTNENNRETAAKALGELGGDHAMYALELTLLNPNSDRFMAKKAAANALRSHGLLTEDSLIFNPLNLRRDFKDLAVCSLKEDGQAITRTTQNFDSLTTFGKRGQITPDKCLGISLKIKGNFNPEQILSNAEKRELAVSLTSSGVVKISGTNWPGFQDGSLHIALEISLSDKINEMRISCGSMETADIGSKWLSAVRTLARIGTVLTARS